MPNHTVFVGQGDASDLHLSLAVTDPCMAVSTWPQLDHPDSVGWVVVESPGCTRSIPPSLRRFDFSMVEARGGGERCVQLYQRGTRGQHRFCGHKGSPRRTYSRQYNAPLAIGVAAISRRPSPA